MAIPVTPARIPTAAPQGGPAPWWAAATQNFGPLSYGQTLAQSNPYVADVGQPPPAELPFGIQTPPLAHQAWQLVQRNGVPSLEFRAPGGGGTSGANLTVAADGPQAQTPAPASWGGAGAGRREIPSAQARTKSPGGSTAAWGTNTASSAAPGSGSPGAFQAIPGPRMNARIPGEASMQYAQRTGLGAGGQQWWQRGPDGAPVRE